MSFPGQNQSPHYHSRFTDELAGQKVVERTINEHTGVTDAIMCRKLCAKNPFCYGINWFEVGKVCEEFGSVDWRQRLELANGYIVSSKIQVQLEGF